MYDEISAGAVLHIIEENFGIKYLILNYSYGHWDFPKGNIEIGETEIETIKREVMEETGIDDIKLIEGFRQQISYRYRKKSKIVNKTVIYYLAETTSNKVILSFEHINFAWLNFNHALEKLSFDNSKKVLRNANEFLTASKINNISTN
ncbi:MAG: NUDIX domain-containing protein [Nitrosopumilus sp.]|nr:NUDIX domain-containing protein [Nitrosopumilus sp.]